MWNLSAIRFAMLLLVACSGAPSGGATRPPATGSAAGPPSDGAHGSAAVASSPSAAECTRLFAHAVALRVAEQQQSLPAARHPTEHELAELRAQLEVEAGAECRAGSRATYECGMAATTLAALEACP